MPSSHLPIRPEAAGRALPERLRRSLETLSGYDLSDVRVHADSVLPEQVGARAFAHGSDIYLQRGAEETLAHEAWHVVQQKQGRVRATRELGSAAEGLGGAGLNDDRELEAEAEVMGRLARLLAVTDVESPPREGLRFAPVGQPSVQRHVEVGAEAYADLSELRVEVANAQKLSSGNVVGLSEILTDILDEDLTFDSWESLAREIRIREVGYQAEAALRELMVKSRKNHVLAAPEARTCEDEENERYANDLKVSFKQRTYADKVALQKGIDARKARVYRGREVIRWTNPVTLSEEARAINHYQIYQWLTGKLETPMAMNCWEVVLYSLILTGLVPKDYMTACIRSRAEPLPELKIDVAMHLIQFIVKNRDYCFVSPNWKSHVSDDMFEGRVMPSAHETEHAPHDSIFIPGRLVIPRGRLLVFGDSYDHFAISTGKRVLLATKKASERFGTMWGHGMLELDGNSGTIRERAIEDLYECKPNYLRRVLTVGPFPIISKAGFVDLRIVSDDAKTTEEKDQQKKEMTAKRKAIRESHKSPILKNKAQAEDKLKVDKDPYLVRKNKIPQERQEKQQNGAPDNEVRALDDELTSILQKLRELDAEWDLKNEGFNKELLEADALASREYSAWYKQNATPYETQRLSYAAHDPYKGLVKFKHQVG